MENKKYIRLLRPKKAVAFNNNLVYSYLVSRPRNKGYSQRFLAKLLGLAPNTIAKIRESLLDLKLIALTRRRRLKAIEPPGEMFHKTKCNNLAYTKIVLPAKTCPLTTKQNAVFWCWQSHKNLGKRIRPRTISRYLGISLNCAKEALKRAQAYVQDPAHYQDARHTKLDVEVRCIVDQIRNAGYSPDQICEVMGLAEHDTHLVSRLFREAQAENDFEKFATSFHLLKHKLQLHRDRPTPVQPPTFDELESRKEPDPLEFIGDVDELHHCYYSGRVEGVSSREFYRWQKNYSPAELLEALRQILYEQPVSTSEFDERLKSLRQNAGTSA